MENSGYGRQSISRPMRIVDPIPKKSCLSGKVHQKNELRFYFFLLLFFQGFRKSKKIRHWTLGSGTKRPLSGVRNTNIKQILISKAKFAQKKLFFAQWFYTFYVLHFKTYLLPFTCYLALPLALALVFTLALALAQCHCNFVTGSLSGPLTLDC